MKLILKGFIIGIGKILPGVSGSVLAISMGIYEKAISSLCNFFKDPINNFKFLLSLLTGIILAIILMSKLLIYFINYHYLPTMLLFIGLMIGGFIPIFKNVNVNKKNIIIFIICFLLTLSLFMIKKNTHLNSSNNLFTYFIIGVIDCITMIIPGISGTAILMILGFYDTFLNMFININIKNFLIFIVGVILTLILICKIIDYLFKNKKQIMYSSILGFSISSILILFISVVKNSYEIKEIIISILLFLIGIIISTKIEA